MDADDIDRLRAHGITDEQATIATQVIGYFNYITRVAEALGVEPEAWFEITRDHWLADKRSDWL